MKRLLLLLTLVPVLGSAQTNNYLDYHKEIIKAEKHIVNREFKESLKIYRNLVDKYEFVFLRDIKVAAQLSGYVNDAENLYYFLEKGMRKGWTLKNIKKHDHLKKYKSSSRWKALKDNQDNYQKEFHQSINSDLRTEVQKMFVKDQKRALRVALTPIKTWRQRYINRKFVPNNRMQVRQINQMIDQIGYPGEKIIGDKSWVTVIISHNEHDTIYNLLRPKLYKALESGEFAAADLAIIETWRVAVDTNGNDQGFVIWNQAVSSEQAIRADSLRGTIGLRSIQLNNDLIETENELKMKFYLLPFHGGLITVKD